MFILRPYVDELKWLINSEQAAWVVCYWTCCWRVASMSSACIRAEGEYFEHMQQ